MRETKLIHTLLDLIVDTDGIWRRGRNGGEYKGGMKEMGDEVGNEWISTI